MDHRPLAALVEPVGHPSQALEVQEELPFQAWPAYRVEPVVRPSQALEVQEALPFQAWLAYLAVLVVRPCLA
jgi:hypothetical protein